MQNVDGLIEQEQDLRMADSSMPNMDERKNAPGFGTNSIQSLYFVNYSENTGGLFGASNARNENANLNRFGGAECLLILKTLYLTVLEEVDKLQKDGYNTKKRKCKE